MSKEKKWEILAKGSMINDQSSNFEKIIKTLLENRKIKTKKDTEAFLHSDITTVTSRSVGIDAKELTKALKRIQKAIKEKEQIIVFGDYDVDGITGTAIIWETLYALGAQVVPYIPSRVEEGYGLSKAGISNIQSQIPNIKLIITVDNGIVANEAVDFADSLGIDVIITDHHTVGKNLPKAYAIVHTTAVCGAAVGYLLSQEISNIKYQISNKYEIPKDHLALVALATVADLVPLTGANRALLKFGLPELRQTRRPGLLALFQEANIDPGKIGVYEIGHMIGPRLNAMGRLESAMDSLRLLCTRDRLKAKVLADTLSRTNKERQFLTQSASLHAIENFRGKKLKKILFIAHEEYEEGIIGLVAGKLVEEFYLPAIVLSKGDVVSKASARSIVGFNIIEFIRTHSHLLINAGGHPMAAGFTIETQNIVQLQEALEKLAEEKVDQEMLQRILRIDCELPVWMVDQRFFIKLSELGPFGMGNPEPTFVSKVVVKEIKTVGADKKHLKLRVGDNKTTLEAIGFGLGDRVEDLKIGQQIQIVYTIAENEWNGRICLQLKIKDLKY